MDLNEFKEYCLKYIGMSPEDVREIREINSLSARAEFDPEKSYAEIIRRTPERLSL